MPYAFIVLGLLMIVTGARNTFRQFGAQVAGDFTGPGNFTYWIASLGGVGALGYVRVLRPFSIAFMTLIVIALILARQGLFPKLTEALAAGPKAPNPVPATPSPGGYTSPGGHTGVLGWMNQPGGLLDFSGGGSTTTSK